MNFAIPLWLKIVGPIVLFLAIVAGVMAWGNSKYNAGYKAGETETDDKWQAASDKMKERAAETATKADDAAVARLEEHVAQAEEDKERVDEATRNGTSPLDALFGGQ